jgi:hypothetical protein
LGVAGPDPAAPDGDRDWPEVWGRWVGRLLGALFLILLIVNLLTGWFF